MRKSGIRTLKCGSGTKQTSQEASSEQSKMTIRSPAFSAFGQLGTALSVLFVVSEFRRTLGETVAVVRTTYSSFVGLVFVNTAA